jgi:hypothetical protein
VAEMDSNFKNLNNQILRTDRPANLPVFRNDIVNSGVLDPRASFTRASTGTYYDKFGVLRTAAAGVPRIDYDPVTGECRGLLVEPAATNLLTYSEQFDMWGRTNCSVLNSFTTAPNGQMSMNKIVEDTSTNTFKYISSSGVNMPQGSTFTTSVYIKPSGRDYVLFGFNTLANVYGLAKFNLATGVFTGNVTTPNSVFISAMCINVGNGVYRISTTWMHNNPVTGAVLRLYFGNSDLTPTYPLTVGSYTGDGSSGVIIWGAQLEIWALPTSYIPTTSAAVTRQADIIKIPSTFTASRLTNSATIQVEAKSAVLATNQTYSTIKSNTSPITQKLIKQTQSKNLLTNSENFSASPWTVSATTISATTTPNPLTETQTVWKLIDTITSATHSVYYNITSGLTVNRPYTYSVYAKASGRDFFAIRWNADTARDAIFNLSTGSIVSADSAIQATIRNIGNGWYRCSMTVRPTSASSRVDFYTSANSTLTAYAGDAVSGTLLFGAQLEADERPTKYVPEPGYSVQLNSITPTQVYGDGKDITKFDRFAITTNGSTVSYAANGKFVGSESAPINQITDIVIGADSSEINQINGHVQKIALYNTTSTNEQLINLSS